MRRFTAISSALQDVKYGARVLRRSPVFTVVAVLSIAGGLAASTTIFALMNGVMFRPIGVGDGDNLYRIFTSSHEGNPYGGSSYADYEAIRDATSVLASTCATDRVRANLLAGGIANEHDGELMSPGCFDALKLSPHRGRFFSEAGVTSPADPPPVVISYSLWVRRFARDPSVIGRTVLLNGMSVAIVAVAPPKFAGTSLDGGADFWARIDVASVVLPPGTLTQRGNRRFTLYARLRDGIGPERAEAALAGVAARLRELDERAWTEASGATRRLTVMRDTDARFADSPGGSSIIAVGALAAVAVIIAIACLNLATMLLARGASRTREISIRLALGASRGRLLRQLATESVLIASLGAVLALGAVWLGLRIFAAYRPSVIPAFDIAIDGRVLLFATVLTIAAALLFGLAPAIHAVRLALAEGLKGRLVTGGGRWLRVGPREGLIVVQVAVSVALLLVATLFHRAMSDRSNLSPGFSTANVAVTSVDLEALADDERPAVPATVLDALESVPNVDVVSLATLIPLMGSSSGIEVVVDGGAPRTFFGNAVSPGYFRTLEIPIRAGRDFDDRDRAGAAPVAIVSETFARSLWGTLNAAGRSVIIEGRQVAVVGVVADIRYRALTEPFLPLLYLPIAQRSPHRFVVHARVRGGAATFAAIDAAVRAADRRAVVGATTSMRAQLEVAMAPERAARSIGSVVGIIQLGLAVMALWGLVAYAVERRTPELGVRLALGATPSSLVRLTMKPAGVSIAIGVAAGCVLGAGAAQVMQAASVGLAPLDLVAVIPVAIVFTIVAMTSAWWPARRAGMADPAASLRRE